MAPRSANSPSRSGSGTPDGGCDSPEAVFEASKKAAIDKDWEADYYLYAPKVREEMASIFAREVAGLPANTNGADRFKDLLVKHGVSESLLSDTPTIGDNAQAFVNESLKRQERIAAAIKDKRAFFVDALTLQHEVAANSDVAPTQMQANLDQELTASATLIDVKINGDRAVGTQEVGVQGVTMKLPLYFQRVNGRWYKRFATPEEAREANESMMKQAAELGVQ